MRARIVVVLVAVLAGLLVAPSSAEAKSHSYAVIGFHKNYRHVFHSTLTWKVFRVSHGRRTLVEHHTWRAGSGFRRRSTDACRRGDGWLPNGRYHPRLFKDYDGSLIKGRAIYLGDMPCHNGTLRRDLFIHTEQGPGSRQCKNRRGDQLCRWEYPQINDYQSHGCIKLSPHDLKQLYRSWRHFTKAHYTNRVRVVVR